MIYNIKLFQHKLLLFIALAALQILLSSFAYVSATTNGVNDVSDDYIIGPQDVIEIIVWENKDLSGKVAVSLDGFINYYLIGKIAASGLTTGQLAKSLTNLLASGFIVNPQVTVQVVEYKSQKVYIVGEAKGPGTYYLTKKTTLVEAISMAGGPTKDADREVIIVRPKKIKKIDNNNPLIITQAEEGVQIKVDLTSALEGNLTQNIFVQGGDSIFIPKAKSYFIMGEVKSPGRYNLERDTTILKAISVAGGTTNKAAEGRTKVIRAVNGKKKEIKVAVHEIVQPEDIIVVPESFF